MTVAIKLSLARQLLPQQSKGIAPLMDDVFRCLKQHYESHYEDVAVRMDTVIQLAHELLVTDVIPVFYEAKALCLEYPSPDR